MIAKRTSRPNVVQPGRAGDQTNGRVENGLQALNVAVGETSDYHVRVVRWLPNLGQVANFIF